MKFEELYMQKIDDIHLKTEELNKHSLLYDCNVRSYISFPYVTLEGGDQLGQERTSDKRRFSQPYAQNFKTWNLKRTDRSLMNPQFSYK